MMLLTHRFPASVDPWRLMREFEHQWSQQFSEWLESAAGSSPSRVRTWSGDGSAVVEIDLPGCQPEAIQVSVLKDLLTVDIKPAEPATEVGEPHIRECQPPAGCEVRLPFLVDPERTSADYQLGVLRVAVHQRQADRPARIAVRS